MFIYLFKHFRFVSLQIKNANLQIKKFKLELAINN